MNVCSVVVYVRPENSATVQKTLEDFVGVEVHAGQKEGKLVVSVEGSSDDNLADTINKFNDIKGVINTTMIYHCNE